MSASANPILVETWRGPHVELWHRGAYCISDENGQVVHSLGNIETPLYGRSAFKFFQTLPLLESGAADAFHVTDREIALACGSHIGEAFHVDSARAWMKRLELKESHFKCGILRPLDREMARSLIQQNESPSILHNTCSGKHLGFLTTALFLKEDLARYLEPDHPVQIKIREALSDLTHFDLSVQEAGTDGCGAPVYAIPLKHMALGMARFSHPQKFSSPRKEAMTRIIKALQDNPLYLAGTHHFCTELIEITEGKVIAKGGAGGVFVALLPRQHLGIAVKIDDGDSRAASALMAALLLRFAHLNEGEKEKILPLSHYPLFNQVKTQVGETKVCV